MAKKEFGFRGKTLEELQEMSIEEFAKLCSSRAKRSLTRETFDKNFLKSLDQARASLNSEKKPKVVRTHRRNYVIIPKMVGLTLAIHKGNGFENVEIKPKMLGHFLGEFALTRKRLLHGKAGIGATRSSTAITAR